MVLVHGAWCMCKCMQVRERAHTWRAISTEWSGSAAGTSRTWRRPRQAGCLEAQPRHEGLQPELVRLQPELAGLHRGHTGLQAGSAHRAEEM